MKRSVSTTFLGRRPGLTCHALAKNIYLSEGRFCTAEYLSMVTIPDDIGQSDRERFLSTLISNLPGFVYRCANDPDWTMAFISDGCSGITGYDPADFIGNRTIAFNDIIVPECRERIWLKWQRLLEKQDVFEEEYRIRTKAGEIRWVWERGRGIFADDGTLLFLEGFISDVTTRKRAEEELAKRSEEFAKKSRYYELLLHTSTDAIHVLDKEGMLREWNDAFLTALGYSAEEAARLNVLDWDAGIPPDELRERITVLIREGGRFETRHRRKDGSVFAVEITATAVVVDGEELLYASARDITGRKRIEDALRKSEAKSRAIIENIQDLVYQTDLEGNLTMISPAGARLSGYASPAEMIGRNLTRDIYADPKEREKFLAVLNEKGEVINYPVTLKDRCGTHFHVTASSHFFFDDKGNVLGVEGVLHDVTEQRKAEEALRQANKKLSLLSGITRHDINNQLLALNGFVVLLHSKNPDPAFEHYFSRIADASRNIAEMITFTKEYEQIGVGVPFWQNVTTVLNTAAKGILPGMVSLNSTVPATLEIFADPLLEKVFFNLLDNSIRHGERVTEIRVSSRMSGEDRLVVWEDDGSGIPADEKERIFERGFGKNTGLGMFLVREILALTGITIRETGEPGSGARFEILVPKGTHRVTGYNTLPGF